jgi:hypothetical protein
MANETESPHDHYAVRAASDPDEERSLAAFWARTGRRTVVQFAPRDDEDLDLALCAGRFGCVLFADLNALLTMVWKSQAQVNRWIEAGVRIELAEPPPAGNDGSWVPVVEAVCDSLCRWRRAQRVRKLVAAVVLSVLALAAAAILLWLGRPGE